MSDKQLIFNSRRSPVFATGGMVASSQPLASQAGLSILMQGGNAADAAIATAAVLNVTEPGSTGLGGDCFALYYEGGSRQITALNGSGRAPAALSLDLLNRQGLKQLPSRHPYTVTVPGACAGWCDLIERFGTLDMSVILKPAIDHAEKGFSVAPISSHLWQSAQDLLLKTSPNGHELLPNSRHAPRTGGIMQNPALAQVMREIAEGGKKVFYEGRIGESIIDTLKSLGGVMTRDDLGEHCSTWEQPISTVYKGVRLYECPPNGQGLTALLAVNLLSQFDLSEIGSPLSARRLHYTIEALRLAFADTRWYISDPSFSKIPLQGLLSEDYAAERAKLINPERATIDQSKGSPPVSSDTVYFSVVDGYGNACSFINSNYMCFGSGIVAKGTGFALQNRGHNFSLQPGHPNILEPKKRPYHTIIPAMAIREDGSLYACFGVMGGFMQPQGHTQVFLALVEDGLDPQQALDRSRVFLEGGDSAGKVAAEEGITDETVAQLKVMGHDVHQVFGHQRSVFGRGQIIMRDPATGVLCGGSDPRSDGCAMGF